LFDKRGRQSSSFNTGISLIANWVIEEAAFSFTTCMFSHNYKLLLLPSNYPWLYMTQRT